LISLISPHSHPSSAYLGVGDSQTELGLVGTVLVVQALVDLEVGLYLASPLLVGDFQDEVASSVDRDGLA
jgi:hypothetical protein